MLFCPGTGENLVSLLPAYEQPFPGAVVIARFFECRCRAMGLLEDAQDSRFILSPVEIDDVHRLRECYILTHFANLS